MRRSKIIATLGPASESPEMIENLIKIGVNLFRFNLKYSPKEWHNQKISLVRKMSVQLKASVGIVVDIPRADFATEINDFDYIALSYLKNADEVINLRKRMVKNGIDRKIIAKIENSSAIDNLNKIVKVSDGIMVARGDLGIETPIKELGFFQKKIIDMCRQNSKPVIVATEMLLSMTHSKTPTRAEATDVANAVFDGTDALMLSEETAVGNYPLEAVKTMMEIAEYCENTDELRKPELIPTNLTESLIEAAAKITRESHQKPIKAIVVFTQSGDSAKIIARYRLGVPVIAVSDDENVLKSLCLSFGVWPFYKKFNLKEFKDEDPVFSEIKQAKLIKNNEAVLVIHGNNWLQSGSTNHLSFRVI